MTAQFNQRPHNGTRIGGAATGTSPTQHRRVRTCRYRCPHDGRLTFALVMPLYTIVRVLSEQKYMSLRQFRPRSTRSLAAMRLSRYISRSRSSPEVVSLLTMNCCSAQTMDDGDNGRALR